MLLEMLALSNNIVYQQYITFTRHLEAKPIMSFLLMLF